jgi:hypothetical protein
MAPSFTWNGASRNTCNQLDMKLSECAARNCNGGIGLFSHLADPVCSMFAHNLVEWCLAHSNHSQNEDQKPSCAIVRHRAIPASLDNSKEQQFARKLHATCIVRIADISFMENTSWCHYFCVWFDDRLILRGFLNLLICGNEITADALCVAFPWGILGQSSFVRGSPLWLPFEQND